MGWSLIWALVAMLTFSGVSCLELNSFTYTLQDTTVLGSSFRFAVADLEFDNELYLSDGAACPLLPAEVEPWLNCTCAFMEEGRCGVAVPAASRFFPDAEIPDGCDEYCASLAEENGLCDDRAPAWQELTPGEVVRTSKPTEGDALYFRYLLADPTVGLRLDVTPQGGSNYLVFGSRSVAAPSRWNADVQFIYWSGRATITLCPGFVEEYGPGTWFFTLSLMVPLDSPVTEGFPDIQGIADVSLLLLPGAQANATYPDPDGCDTLGTGADQQGIYTFPCIRDGDTYRLGVNPELIVFYMMVHECKVYHAHVHSPDGDRDLYMSFQKPNLFDRFDDYAMARYIYGDDEFSFNPCGDGRQPPFPMWFLVDYLGSFYFTVSSETVSLTKRLADWAPAPVVQGELIHTSRFYCDELPFDSNNLDCNLWGRDCRYSWPIFPFANPVPGYPLPSSLSSDRPAYLTSTLLLGDGSDPRWPKVPNKYSQVVLLDTTRVSSGLFEVLSKCYIWFPAGNLADASGHIFTGKYYFGEQPTSPECDTDQFDDIVDLATDIFSNLTTLAPEDSRYITESVFALDTIRGTPLWQVCESELHDLIDYTSTTVVRDASAPCLSPDLSDEYYLDPCCSLDGSMVSVCPTVPTDITVQIPVQVNASAFEHSSCSSCSLYALEQLVQLESSTCNLQIESVNGDTSLARIHTLWLVDECMRDTMGPVLSDGSRCNVNEGDPICTELVIDERYHAGQCTSDADCPLAGSVCDRLTLSCLVPAAIQEQSLIRCIVDGLSESSMSALIRSLEPVPASPPPLPFESIVEELLWNRSRIDNCVGDFTLPLARRDRWVVETMDPRCAFFVANVSQCDNLLVTDNQRAVKGQNCRDDCGDNGQLRFYPSSQEYCLDQTLCNRNGDIWEEEQCLAVSNFCGFCSDPSSESSCIEIPGITNQNSCEQAQVCLMPDNTIRTDLTPQACQQIGECSGTCSTYRCEGSSPACGALSEEECIDCGYFNATSFTVCPSVNLLGECYPVYDRPCANEGECTSVGGTCSDRSIISMSQEFNGNAAPGFCRVPYPVRPFMLSPYMTCGETEFTDYTYIGCNNIDSSGPGNCGGEWIWAATDEDTCLSFRSCVLDAYSHQLTLNRRANYHDEDNCILPNERWMNAFAWTPAVWTTGRVVRPSWVATTFEARYRWDETIDFNVLMLDLVSNADLASSSALQADGVCRYSREPQFLDVLACDCLSENDNSDASDTFDSCAELDDDLVSLITTFFHCTDDLEATDGTEIYVDPMFLSLPGDAIRQVDVCSLVEVSLISDLRLQRKVIPQVPLSFASRPQLGTTEVVVNSHDVVVGRIIGDGINFYSTNGIYPVNFRLCVRCDPALSSHVDQYSVLDFGTRTRNNRVLPLELPVEYVEGSGEEQLCITFSEDGETPFDPDRDYIPILKREDWTEPSSEFSSSSLALLYTLAAIYALMFLVTVVVIFHKFTGGSFVSPLVSIALGAVVIITTMRFTYFFMAPAGVFAQGQYTNLEFVYIIFPIYVLYSLFALQSAAWLLTINQFLTVTKLMWWFFWANVLFYLTFVIWTILFATLTPEIGSSCAGLIEPTVDSSRQDALNLAFTIFLVVLAVILAVSFSIAPFHLLASLHRADSSVNGMAIQLLSRVGPPMFGLILIAVLILILSVGATTSQYFVFFMLLAGEIAPLLLLLFRLVFAGGEKHPSSSTPKTGASNFGSGRSMSNNLERSRSVGRSGSIGRSGSSLT